MNRSENGSVGSEQLLPLWTWLLHGHLPVAHIVADLDESDAPESHESDGEPTGGARRAATPLTCAEAA